MKTAEIVSVGTELLLGQIVDTHAATLARMLASCGIVCQRRVTVGDNLDRVAGILRESLTRADLVLTIGGLGPTMDDLTRDAIALALDDPLVHESKVELALRQFFGERGTPWVESNARQAYRPACATLIDNPNGTAPGLCCRKGGKVVIALPGPRGEFGPMAEGPVRVLLEELQSGIVIHSRILRVCGMGESLVEERVAHLMKGDNPTLAPYAHPGEVHLRMTARAASRQEAERLLDPLDRQIREVLGAAVFGIDGTTLESAVLDLLLARSCTVAVAESLTGGELGARLTSVAGASRAFRGGMLAYSGVAKSLLGVREETLALHGEISPECASEMAEQVRVRFSADYGVALTGNAGPGAAEEKPVGLVFCAVADEGKSEVINARWRGTRADVRLRSTQMALVQLRERLLQSGS
jgi:nicotinamide-nucleotide amidase